MNVLFFCYHDSRQGNGDTHGGKLGGSGYDIRGNTHKDQDCSLTPRIDASFCASFDMAENEVTRYPHLLPFGIIQFRRVYNTIVISNITVPNS